MQLQNHDLKCRWVGLIWTLASELSFQCVNSIWSFLLNSFGAGIADARSDAVAFSFSYIFLARSLAVVKQNVYLAYEKRSFYSSNPATFCLFSNFCICKRTSLSVSLKEYRTESFFLEHNLKKNVLPFYQRCSSIDRSWCRYCKTYIIISLRLGPILWWPLL